MTSKLAKQNQWLLGSQPKKMTLRVPTTEWLVVHRNGEGIRMSRWMSGPMLESIRLAWLNWHVLIRSSLLGILQCAPCRRTHRHKPPYDGQTHWGNSLWVKLSSTSISLCFYKHFSQLSPQIVIHKLQNSTKALLRYFLSVITSAIHWTPKVTH